MPRKSKIPIEVGGLFGYWRVLGLPEKGRVQCLCTGCNVIQKNILVGKLRQGSSRSCGCRQKELSKQTWQSNLGVDNPAKNLRVKTKKGETMLDRYGVLYTGQSEELRKKIEATCLKKYGQKTNLGTEDFKQKTKTTSLKKYGTECPSQNSEVIEKGLQTRKQKYDTEWYQQTEEFKRRYEETCLKKYNVKNPMESEEIKKKRKDSCQSKYGEDSFLATEQFKNAKKEAMIERYGKEHYAQTTSYKENQRQHYRLMDNKLTIAEIARAYNICQTTLNNVYNNFGEEAAFEYCKKNQNKIRIFSTEIAMIKLLETHVLIKKYDKHPKEFKLNRRPDFRIEHNNTVLYLNIDGLSDHSEIGRRRLDKNYHFDLAEQFRKNNQTIFQFREDELRDKKNIVKSIVLNHLGFSKKIYARKCSVRRVPSADARKFLEDNHLMGYAPAQSYGLYYEERLMSVMSTKQKKEGIDIARFCTIINFTIVGGFSKLLKHIATQRSPKFITSYLDLRYSTGKSYERCGFQLEKAHLSWKWTNKVDTFNRLKCKANMDARKLTQAEHAAELKWYKIYDAGQAKYIKWLEQDN